MEHTKAPEQVAPVLERAMAVQDSPRVIVLTGAGISAESGIPTFRGEEGYWTVGSTNYRPETLATREAFGKFPDEIWRWYLYRRSVCSQAEPNVAHRALVDLEARLGDAFSLVTQNVDGLHRLAGSKRAFSIHGDIGLMRFESEYPKVHPIPAEVPMIWERDTPMTDLAMAALTSSTGELARPHVLWFDESYDDALFHMTDAMNAAKNASLLVVIGTSANTTLPLIIGSIIAERRVPMIVINRDENAFSDYVEEESAGVFLKGKAGELLPAVCDAIAARFIERCGV